MRKTYLLPAEEVRQTMKLELEGDSEVKDVPPSPGFGCRVDIRITRRPTRDGHEHRERRETLQEGEHYCESEQYQLDGTTPSHFLLA